MIEKIIVCIIEDEESICELFTDYFEQFDDIELHFCKGEYESCSFSNGFPIFTTVIINDIHIPCRVRKCLEVINSGFIPVIHISGDEKLLKDIGGKNDYTLVKPFNLSELNILIRHIKNKENKQDDT